jgi:hypothetical protein
MLFVDITSGKPQSLSALSQSRVALGMADLDKLRLELQLDLERMRGEIIRWMFAQTLLMLGVITTLHFIR